MAASDTNASLVDLMRTIAATPCVDADIRSRASVLSYRLEGRDPLREMFSSMGCRDGDHRYSGL